MEGHPPGASSRPGPGSPPQASLRACVLAARCSTASNSPRTVPGTRSLLCLSPCPSVAPAPCSARHLAPLRWLLAWDTEWDSPQKPQDRTPGPGPGSPRRDPYWAGCLCAGRHQPAGGRSPGRPPGNGIQKRGGESRTKVRPLQSCGQEHGSEREPTEATRKAVDLSLLL